MSQQRQETLSAFFDGELGEFELRRLLSELNSDDVQQWRRYQLLRDCCQKGEGLTHYQFDISDKVAAEIAQQSTAASKQKWLKPLLGFASAAAIAFVAVFGVQQWQLQEQATPGFVAEGNVSASQIPLNSSPGLSTASAKSTPFEVPKERLFIEDEKAEQEASKQKEQTEKQ